MRQQFTLALLITSLISVNTQYDPNETFERDVNEYSTTESTDMTTEFNFTVTLPSNGSQLRVVRHQNEDDIPIQSIMDLILTNKSFDTIIRELNGSYLFDSSDVSSLPTVNDATETVFR